MSILDDIRDKVLGIFNKELKSEFVQYHHEKENDEINCKNPCLRCTSNNLRIFENNSNKPPIEKENHPNCHCTYEEVEQKPVGSISKMGDLAPDVYLKRYGKLPDYYITKEEAKEKYGWNPRRNTMEGKAPGKMIGGNIFNNEQKILPMKEGRIWYECDVDYTSGNRGTCSRLYYSNDGLMFYSDHFKDKVYQIK